MYSLKFQVRDSASAKKETRTAPSNESSVTQSSLVDSHSVNNRASCIDDSAIRYHMYYHRGKQFRHEFPRNTKNMTLTIPLLKPAFLRDTEARRPPLWMTKETTK